MKALVVEDNAGLRQMFHIFLESIGFQSDEASDGNSAFNMIQKNEYDVIISDMDMPDANGMELYQLLDTYMPQLIKRLIFTTGNEFSEEYRAFFKTVPCPMLIKPFSLFDLQGIIQRISGTRSKRKPPGGGHLKATQACA